MGDDLKHNYFNNYRLDTGLRIRSRSRSRKVSKVFGWSWSRFPNNTGSRSRIFCPTPTLEVQLDHFLHHTPKLGIPIEMVEFLLKLLLNQRFIAVHHDFHWFWHPIVIPFMLRSRKFWKGRSRKFWKIRVGNCGMSESDILPPTPQPCLDRRDNFIYDYHSSIILEEKQFAECFLQTKKKKRNHPKCTNS